MRRVLLIVLLFTVSCKNKVTSEDIKSEMPASFKEVTGYDAKDVTIIKEDDYLYTGYVVLTDGSKALIEVKIDKENPDQYIWQVTQPSQSMITDMVDKAFEDFDTEIDSILDSELTEYK